MYIVMKFQSLFEKKNRNKKDPVTSKMCQLKCRYCLSIFFRYSKCVESRTTIMIYDLKPKFRSLVR